MDEQHSQPTPTTPINELMNMNSISADWLRSIGISNYEELAAGDLFEIWIDIKDKYHKADKTLYYALWGAVHNKRWSEIPQSEKDALAHKIGNLHL